MTSASALIPALFILGTVGLALAVYGTMRAVLKGRHADDTQTLAGSVIVRVASLHGLILALVFAQEMVDYHLLEDNLLKEATAIADIYNDIRRYEPPAATVSEVQDALRAYTHLVIEEEWRTLAENQRLSGTGWVLRETFYAAILDLVPETPRQEDLRAHMVDRAQLVAELRQARENTVLNAVSPLFWIAALAGIVMVTIPYFVFSPTRLHLTLLAVYGGFSGLVMFVIYAFSDPLSAPGALHPHAFERLLETEIGG